MEPTASFLLIGNELLSGRTQDVNVRFLASHLLELGIEVTEVRMIPDNRKIIGTHVLELSQKSTYVFTTGGIGPTHDDVTTEAIAFAFGVDLVESEEINEKLLSHEKYRGDTHMRRRLSLIPRGARLLPCGIKVIPSFVFKNVFVLAGMPSVMRPTFFALKGDLVKGSSFFTTELTSLNAFETDFALVMQDIQERHPNVDIGSYPFYEEERKGVTLSLKSHSEKELEEVRQELLLMFSSLNLMVQPS